MCSFTARVFAKFVVKYIVFMTKTNSQLPNTSAVYLRNLTSETRYLRNVPLWDLASEDLLSNHLVCTVAWVWMERSQIWQFRVLPITKASVKRCCNYAVWLASTVIWNSKDLHALGFIKIIWENNYLNRVAENMPRILRTFCTFAFPQPSWESSLKRG